MTKEQVLSELKENGIVLAEIDYCGGNDEGGAEAIKLYQEDGNYIDISLYGTWNPNTRKYDPAPESPLNDDTVQALQKPIYDKYHTFAGEFYVSGTLIWDVKKGTASLDGSEGNMVYEPFEEPII